MVRCNMENFRSVFQWKCVLLFTVITVLVVGMFVLGIPFVDMKQRLRNLEQQVGCKDKTSDEHLENKVFSKNYVIYLQTLPSGLSYEILD